MPRERPPAQLGHTAIMGSKRLLNPEIDFCWGGVRGVIHTIIRNPPANLEAIFEPWLHINN
jgi:hypothetical protein